MKTSKYTKSGNIHSHYWVMEAVVAQCSRLNLTRYQLQIKIPPRESTVVPKLRMMWTIDSSLTAQNQPIYKIWEHS
jgi:hypothetical protein